MLPVLLLVGGGVGVFMSGLLDPLLGGDQAAEEQTDAPQVARPGVYMEVPEMLVSLRSTGNRQRILKLRINLELQSRSDEETIKAFMPKIVDNFQVFLRELRIEELEGSQGLYRIKEEMLARVNQAASPVTVKDVLIGDMLIQ